MTIGLWARSAVAAPPIHYQVILDRPQTQLVTIEITIPQPGGPTTDLRLPTWRPGRYSIDDPASTIRAVTARRDDTGLEVRKIDKSTWRIDSGDASAISVRYDVYANELPRRTRHVDDTHAFLSGESLFMYIDERRGDRSTVGVRAPAGWKVTTALEPRPGAPFTWIAPDYDTLIDCPMEVGTHSTTSFMAGGKPHELAIWGTDRFDAERIMADLAAIVREQKKIFGRLPYERFVFLVHAAPGLRGATEHANSTIIQVGRGAIEDSLENGDAYRSFLGIASHEMFHVWNIEQFRPAGLTPYDYQRENYTELLWIVEGTTSYYDDLTLLRNGLMTPKRYFSRISRSITNLRERPGADVQSLADSSFDAWIKYTRSHGDSINSTISFYSKGALVSLLLDLQIRTDTGGVFSLDDVMIRLFQRFPLGGPGYTSADLAAILLECGLADPQGFLDRYVSGTQRLQYDTLLEHVGLELIFEPANDDDSDAGEYDDAVAEPYLGVKLTERDGRAIVTAVLSDGPAEAAGLNVDDEIVAIAGRRLRASDLQKALDRHDIGATITVHVMRRDVLREIPVTLIGRPAGRWTVRFHRNATAEQRRAFTAWSEQPWPSDPPPNDDED